MQRGPFGIHGLSPLDLSFPACYPLARRPVDPSVHQYVRPLPGGRSGEAEADERVGEGDGEG